MDTTLVNGKYTKAEPKKRKNLSSKIQHLTEF